MSTAVVSLPASPVGSNERGGSSMSGPSPMYSSIDRTFRTTANPRFMNLSTQLEEHEYEHYFSEDESHSGEVFEISSSSLNGHGPAAREGQSTEDYLLLRADTATMADVAKFLVKGSNAGKVVETGNESPEEFSTITAVEPDVRWVIMFCAVLHWIIFFFKRQMEWFGLVSEFFINGGDLRGLIQNMLTGNRVVPDRKLETYRSVVGLVDPRFVLHKSNTKSTSEQIEYIRVPPLQMDNQALMDLCVMASKVAYENAAVVQNIVNKQWKMHFVKFYNFWNGYRKERSTQAFIMSDKQLDADIILISFRGARTLNADDLSVAFDYSWYHVPGMGKVEYYIEFLFTPLDSVVKDKETAYFTLRNMLRSLLAEHPRAKFLVTGHGTGGALAALLPVILLFNEERELLKRWSCVYTSGQPRIGDEQLREFMQEHVEKYFRVLYGNDMMPRLPYDDGVFFYKHFGQGLHYNSLYFEKIVKVEPDQYFFGLWSIIPEFVTSIWEFVRGLAMQYMYGAEYKETWFLFFFRVLALVEPAASAHCITNYINCARLGRRVRGAC